MTYKAEASEKEWRDCYRELATHYDEINEQNAKEILRFSEFGDQKDSYQVKSLVEDASSFSKQNVGEK